MAVCYVPDRFYECLTIFPLPVKDYERSGGGAVREITVIICKAAVRTAQ